MSAMPTTRPFQLSAEFVQNRWLRAPCLLPTGPVGDVATALNFEVVQETLEGMAPKDIIYRDASGGTAARMHALAHPAWSAVPLEARLTSETTSLMLTDVHLRDERYAELLAITLHELAKALSIRPSSLKRPSASLFLSSPHAISSYHTDREHNFLLQICGSKTLHVFPKRESLAHEIITAFLRPRKGIHDQYRMEFEKSASLFEIRPPQVLYIPRIWPHWVENGPQASISLSMNFFSQQSFAIEQIYKINDWMRRQFLMLLPAPQKADVRAN